MNEPRLSRANWVTLLLRPSFTANCRSTKWRVDPLCSHADGDQREQRRRRGAGSTASGRMSSAPPDATFEGPVRCWFCSDGRERRINTSERNRIRKKYRLLMSNVLRHLPCQLAGTSPVFLRHQGYQPQTLALSHIYKKRWFCFLFSQMP